MEENNNQPEQNNTQQTRKLGLRGAIIVGLLSAYVGWGAYLFYKNPLVYLRPHIEQEAKRTVDGVEINRKEYERFSKVLDYVVISANYRARGFISNEPQLDIHRIDNTKKSWKTEYFSDKGNDGKVDSFRVNGAIFEREEHLELFKQKVDPKFAEYKQKLNVDQIVAEKMQEPAPTIVDFLKE